MVGPCVEGENLEPSLVQNQEKKKRKANLTRSGTCGMMVTGSHQCWTREKRVTCFKCGQPNHIAIYCKNQPGVTLQNKGTSNVDQALKKIERLVKIKDLLLNNLGGPVNSGASIVNNDTPFVQEPTLATP